MVDSIHLDIEESNELLFKIKIEGNTNSSPAKVRMVCEGNDVSYMFPGRPMEEGDDLVQFLIPKMDRSVKPGIYSSRVEVMVENRYFVPVEFEVSFEKTLSVVAENMTKIEGPKQKTVEKEIGISVSTIAAPINLTEMRKQEKTLLKKINRAEEKVILSEDQSNREIVNEIKNKVVSSKNKTLDEHSLRQIARSIIQKKFV